MWIRYKAAYVNELFVKKLTDFKPLPGLKDVYKIIFEEVNNNMNGAEFSDKKSIHLQIEKQNARLSKARDLMINGDLSGDDYREIKEQANEEILRLQTQLDTLRTDPQKSLKKEFEKPLEYAEKLDFYFLKANTALKKES